MKKSTRKSQRTNVAATAGMTPSPQKQAIPVPTGFAGKPLDGSQYVDVIEEQEYADQRPSAEEQKPRFSYLKH